jgi:hypothetical protein
MSQEDTLRLAAEVVDKFSGPLREMTKSVHAFQDMMKGAHTEGSKGAKEQAKQQLELHDAFEKTARSVQGFVTPSMTALGLSVGGAGAAIGALIGKLRESSDSFYKIQDAMARTGQTAPQLDALVQTMGRFGINADAAREHASKLGDTIAQLHRQFSPTVAALESTFTDLHPLIDRIAQAKSIEEGNRIFWEYYWSSAVQAAPVDKRRKLLTAVDQDPMFATVNKKQFEEIQAEEKARVAANPDLTMAQIEKLRKAFEALDATIDNIWRAMKRTFADDGPTWIDTLSESIKRNVEDVKVMIQDWKDFASWVDNVRKKYGLVAPDQNGEEDHPGTAAKPLMEPRADKYSPASRFAGGYMPMSFTTGGDAESTFSRGVHVGTLGALQEWYASLQTGGGGGAGIVKANFGSSAGDGGGGRGWGGYSALPEGSMGEAGAGGKPMRGGGPRPAPGGVGNAAGGGGDGGPTGSGSAYLQAERARYGKELGANPELKKRLAAIVDLENPKAGTAVTESLMNRMNLVHGSLEHGIAEGPRSFYGPARHPGMVEARMRELEVHPKRMNERMAQIDAALAGSNFTKGYTDQGSRGDPNYERGGVGVNINGERFNDWGVAGARAYRENQQAHVLSGGQRDLLANGAAAGVGGVHKVEGNASLDVNFRNAPAGAQAYLRYGGLFKSAKTDWGHSMPASDPGGGS